MIWILTPMIAMFIGFSAWISRLHYLININSQAIDKLMYEKEFLENKIVRIIMEQALGYRLEEGSSLEWERLESGSYQITAHPKNCKCGKIHEEE